MNVKNDLELEKEIASIVNIIEDKKGQDVKVYDMRGRSPFFDYSILCTGSSSRNIEAIASDIKKSLTNIRNVEGLEECNWVLIDGGDIRMQGNTTSWMHFIQELTEIRQKKR